MTAEAPADIDRHDDIWDEDPEPRPLDAEIPRALFGYDRAYVDAFVADTSQELLRLTEENRELRDQLEAAVRAGASAEARLLADVKHDLELALGKWPELARQLA